MSLLVLSALTLSAFTSYIVAAALLAFLLYPIHQRLSGVLGARLSAFLLVGSSTIAAAIPLVAVIGMVLTNATEVSDELDQRPILAAVDRLLTSLGISVDLPAAVRELQTQLLTTLVGEVSDLFGVAVKLIIGVSLVVFLLYLVLLAFVPVIGVAVVWVPASVYLFLVDQTVSALFLFVYGSTVVSWIDNYLRTLLVDRESGLHAGTVLAGVLGGIYFWGVFGLFIGPIVLGLFKAALIVYVDVYGSTKAVDSTRAADSTAVDGSESESEGERGRDQAVLASFPGDR